jgi:predicted helicase
LSENSTWCYQGTKFRPSNELVIWEYDYVLQLRIRMQIKATRFSEGSGQNRIDWRDVSLPRGSGDEGIDGIIKEDRLGLEVVYIQAKRWENTVQRPEIQKFVGALSGQNARKGVFITTSSFSVGAIDYATGLQVKVVPIDGET